MLKQTLLETDPSQLNLSPLQKELNTISEKCINCKLCQKECEFLRRYGKPKEIADSYNPSDKVQQAMPFECSLCQLCAAVCPVKINPANMFLEMRKETVTSGNGDYSEHSAILGYEKRGTSKSYTFYAIPKGCDTIFFPGCTLPGTRPDKVLRLYEHMKKTIPSIGIVLDCCTKPSHDLGREKYFSAMFREMKDFLVTNGVRKVIVACPNCYKIFNKYGSDLSVTTVYEFMAANGLPEAGQIDGVITLHDPCSIRFEASIQSSVRELSKRKGLTIVEMKHSEEKTLCCGEGGSACFISPDLTKNWGLLRKKEAEGRRIVTYCAGCANRLSSLTPTSHILDIVFEPEATMAANVKVSKAPLTYLNRIRLKKQLKNMTNGSMTRERTFRVEQINTFRLSIKLQKVLNKILQGGNMNKKKTRDEEMSRGEFIKTISAGICVAGLYSLNGISAFGGSSEKGITKTRTGESQNFPTKENPLIMDEKGKRVLIYTEVHEMNVHQSNVHWGVVFKDGKFQDRAILRAYSNQLDFHDALIKIGAKPGNNLSRDTVGQYVQGDTLDVRATWPGLGKELSLNEIFVDETGKGFNIKFGGNRKASEEQKTGCVTCLESCWISISSNANYPQTSPIKRFINPNSRFKGRADVLPGDGKPVILIYKIASAK